VDYKKSKKNVRSFTGHLITQPLTHNYYQKSQSPTLNILLRNVDRRNYAT